MGAVQSLPQELIDHIIDHIIDLSRGTEHLKALSRVSTAWRARSQYHIFKKCTLNIGKLEEIYSEISKPAGTSASQERISILFSYTHRLRIDGGNFHPRWRRHRAYLKIFHLFINVTDLRIYSWDFGTFETSDLFDLFAPLGETVTTLDITDCVDNSAVLIFLKSLFPRVNDFRVCSRRSEHLARNYRIQEPHLSRRVEFRGKLAFYHLDGQHDGFLAFVGKNCSGVHSIIVRDCKGVGELRELFFGCQASKLTSVDFGSSRLENRISKFTHVRTGRHSAHVVPPSLRPSLILHSAPNLINPLSD